MSKPTDYRIEQRITRDGQESTVGISACIPHTGMPLTRNSGIALLAQRAAQRPDLYGPHGDQRLVLVPADAPIGGRR